MKGLHGEREGRGNGRCVLGSEGGARGRVGAKGVNVDAVEDDVDVPEGELVDGTENTSDEITSGDVMAVARKEPDLVRNSHQAAAHGLNRALLGGGPNQLLHDVAVHHLELNPMPRCRHILQPFGTPMRQRHALRMHHVEPPQPQRRIHGSEPLKPPPVVEIPIRIRLHEV